MVYYLQDLYLLNNELIIPLLKKYMEDTSGYCDMVRRPAAYLETVTVVSVLTESKGQVVYLHAVKA
jgi:hypothetical protein